MTSCFGERSQSKSALQKRNLHAIGASGKLAACKSNFALVRLHSGSFGETNDRDGPLMAKFERKSLREQRQTNKQNRQRTDATDSEHYHEHQVQQTCQCNSLLSLKKITFPFSVWTDAQVVRDKTCPRKPQQVRTQFSGRTSQADP